MSRRIGALGRRVRLITALVLDRREFHALLEEDPIGAVRLLPAIGARLRRLRQSTQEHPPLV